MGREAAPAFGVHHGRNRSMVTGCFRPIADFRHDIVCAYEIERRPRGASRINPLLRLFLANYV